MGPPEVQGGVSSGPNPMEGTLEKEDLQARREPYFLGTSSSMCCSVRSRVMGGEGDRQLDEPGETRGGQIMWGLRVMLRSSDLFFKPNQIVCKLTQNNSSVMGAWERESRFSECWLCPMCFI